MLIIKVRYWQVLTKEQNSNFIKRVLEIEQELKQYPELKKELDIELIKITRDYNKAHKSQGIGAKKRFVCVQVLEKPDMIQARFRLVREEL